jgi:hypothetical protein
MRSRTIKPGFFSNENLGALPPVARILFIALWLIADREGRLEDRPKRIKVESLPFDSADTNKLLDLLAAGADPFIVRYAVNGVRYIQILNFSKHQHPHPRELPSIIPEYVEATPRQDLGYVEARPRQDQGKTKDMPRQDLGHVEATPSRAGPSLTGSSLTGPSGPSFSSDADAPVSSPAAPEKKKAQRYGSRENVKLRRIEYLNLIDTIGKVETERWIERLSEGLAVHGYKYPSHYEAILYWRRREAEAKAEAKAAGVNYEQRDFDPGLYPYETVVAPPVEVEKGVQ